MTLLTTSCNCFVFFLFVLVATNSNACWAFVSSNNNKFKSSSEIFRSMKQQHQEVFSTIAATALDTQSSSSSSFFRPSYSFIDNNNAPQQHQQIDDNIIGKILFEHDAVDDEIGKILLEKQESQQKHQFSSSKSKRTIATTTTSTSASLSNLSKIKSTSVSASTSATTSTSNVSMDFTISISSTMESDFMKMIRKCSTIQDVRDTLKRIIQVSIGVHKQSKQQEQPLLVDNSSSSSLLRYIQFMNPNIIATAFCRCVYIILQQQQQQQHQQQQSRKQRNNGNGDDKSAATGFINNNNSNDSKFIQLLLNFVSVKLFEATTATTEKSPSTKIFTIYTLADVLISIGSLLKRKSDYYFLMKPSSRNSNSNNHLFSSDNNHNDNNIITLDILKSETGKRLKYLLYPSIQLIVSEQQKNTKTITYLTPTKLIRCAYACNMLINNNHYGEKFSSSSSSSTDSSKTMIINIFEKEAFSRLQKGDAIAKLNSNDIYMILSILANKKKKIGMRRMSSTSKNNRDNDAYYCYNPVEKLLIKTLLKRLRKKSFRQSISNVNTLCRILVVVSEIGSIDDDSFNSNHDDDDDIKNESQIMIYTVLKDVLERNTSTGNNESGTGSNLGGEQLADIFCSLANIGILRTSISSTEDPVFHKLWNVFHDYVHISSAGYGVGNNNTYASDGAKNNNNIDDLEEHHEVKKAIPPVAGFSLFDISRILKSFEKSDAIEHHSRIIQLLGYQFLNHIIANDDANLTTNNNNNEKKRIIINPKIVNEILRSVVLHYRYDKLIMGGVIMEPYLLACEYLFADVANDKNNEQQKQQLSSPLGGERGEFSSRCQMKDLANLLWFLNRAHYYSPNLLLSIGDRTLQLLQSSQSRCTPKQACAILSAFTSIISHSNSKRHRQQTPSSLLSSSSRESVLPKNKYTLLSERLDANGNDGNKIMIEYMLSDLFHNLGQHTLEVTAYNHLLSPGDVSSILYSHAKASYLQKDSNNKIFNHLVSLMVSFDSNECTTRQISQSLWSCAKMAVSHKVSLQDNFDNDNDNDTDKSSRYSYSSKSPSSYSSNNNITFTSKSAKGSTIITTARPTFSSFTFSASSSDDRKNNDVTGSDYRSSSPSSYYYKNAAWKLATRLVDRLDELSTEDIAQSIWSFGILQINEAVIIKSFAKTTLESASNFNNQQIVNILRGLSRINFYDDSTDNLRFELVNEFVARASAAMIEMKNDINDAATITIAADTDKATALSSSSSHSTTTTTSLLPSSYEVTIVLAALGKMEMRDQNMYDTLYNVLLNRLDTISPQEITACLLSYRLVNLIPPKKLLDSWAKRKLGLNTVRY